MRDSFTQSGGTLTITSSSAEEDGGVVDFAFDMLFEDVLGGSKGCFGFHPLNGPRFHTLSTYIAACPSWYSNSHKLPEVLPAFSCQKVNAV